MSTPKRFRTRTQKKKIAPQNSLFIKGNVSLILNTQNTFRTYGPFKKINKHAVVSYIIKN